MIFFSFREKLIVKWVSELDFPYVISYLNSLTDELFERV